MTINLNDYEFRTYYDPEALNSGGAFLAEVISWEHVKGHGQSPDEAARMCREVLWIHVKCALEDGVPIPPPVKGVSLAAATLGRLGGRSRSPAKLAAVRRNAQKAGRPKGSKNKPRELKAA